MFSLEEIEALIEEETRKATLPGISKKKVNTLQKRAKAQ